MITNHRVEGDTGVGAEGQTQATSEKNPAGTSWRGVVLGRIKPASLRLKRGGGCNKEYKNEKYFPHIGSFEPGKNNGKLPSAQFTGSINARGVRQLTITTLNF